MNVTVECPCGASMAVDDASELVTNELLKLWNGQHDAHRRTLEEFEAQLRSYERARTT